MALPDNPVAFPKNSEVPPIPVPVGIAPFLTDGFRSGLAERTPHLWNEKEERLYNANLSRAYHFDWRLNQGPCQGTTCSAADRIPTSVYGFILQAYPIARYKDPSVWANYADLMKVQIVTKGGGGAPALESMSLFAYPKPQRLIFKDGYFSNGRLIYPGHYMRIHPDGTVDKPWTLTSCNETVSIPSDLRTEATDTLMQSLTPNEGELPDASTIDVGSTIVQFLQGLEEGTFQHPDPIFVMKT